MPAPRASPSFTALRSPGGVASLNDHATTWMTLTFGCSHLRRGSGGRGLLRGARDLGQVDDLEHCDAAADVEHADRPESPLTLDTTGSAPRERRAPRVHEEHAVLQDRRLAVGARVRDDVDRAAELLAQHGAHVDSLERGQAAGR